MCSYEVPQNSEGCGAEHLITKNKQISKNVFSSSTSARPFVFIPLLLSHSCMFSKTLYFSPKQQIRDGGLPTSPSLGKFCGTSLPPPVFSTGNELFVHFVTDPSVPNDGFRLEYITNGESYLICL